jgi:membrane protease YdiL (CAAX protease family)
MKKLYEANELVFTAVMAVLNLFVCLLGRELSYIIGINRLGTALLILLEIICVYRWINKNGWKEKYGLCKYRKNKEGLNEYIYYLPLLILVALRFTRGCSIKYSLIDTVLCIIVSMEIGFIEEIIYRGFLFKALCIYDEGLAVLISSMAFGMIHVIHLLDGGNFTASLIHVYYAASIGFLFCIIFYERKSLWLCILAHGIYNSCEVFTAGTTTMFNYWVSSMLKAIVSVGFGLYILKKAGSDILMNMEV